MYLNLNKIQLPLHWTKQKTRRDNNTFVWNTNTITLIEIVCIGLTCILYYADDYNIII